jgi:hypothetical protein
MQSIGWIFFANNIYMIFQGFNIRPSFFSRRAYHLEDKIQLLKLSLSLENSVPKDQFSHDAANRPNIQLY